MFDLVLAPRPFSKQLKYFFFFSKKTLKILIVRPLRRVGILFDRKSIFWGDNNAFIITTNQTTKTTQRKKKKKKKEQSPTKTLKR